MNGMLSSQLICNFISIFSATVCLPKRRFCCYSARTAEHFPPHILDRSEPPHRPLLPGPLSASKSISSSTFKCHLLNVCCFKDSAGMYRGAQHDVHTRGIDSILVWTYSYPTILERRDAYPDQYRHATRQNLNAYYHENKSARSVSMRNQLMLLRLLFFAKVLRKSN
jgi:hypothetical protein